MGLGRNETVKPGDCAVVDAVDDDSAAVGVDQVVVVDTCVVPD